LRRKATLVEASARSFVLKAWVEGLTMGAGVHIQRGVDVVIRPGGRMILDRGVFLSPHVALHVASGGLLHIEEEVFIGHGTVIMATEFVSIGRGAALAENVSIRDHDHVLGLPPGEGGLTSAPVRIGEGVWLAAKVSVTQGCTVGDLAVVGANAVVTGDLPSSTLSVGVPARVVRQLNVDRSRH
jgi:acetyltransferase-like isoleucine patch superfamily enzyme